MTAPPTPTALEALYSTPKPGRSIKLFRGTIALEDHPRLVRGRGGMDLVLTSNTRIEFRLGAPGRALAVEAFTDQARVVIPHLGASAKMLLSNVRTTHQLAAGGSPRARYTGLVNGGIAFGTGSGLERGLAHIFNLQAFHGDVISDGTDTAWWPGRTTFMAGGWQLTMDAVPSAGDLIRQLRLSESHAITHVVEARRQDGSPFDAAEFGEVVEALGWLLSFGRAAWTFSPLLAGFVGTGAQPVWQEWSDRRLDPWTSRLAWWDTRTVDSAAEIASVLQGMWPIWIDTQRGDVLRVAINLLVEASSRLAVETRILIAQAALELLAWQRLVNEGTWTAPRFEGASATNQFRGLLAECGVDARLPASLATAAADPALNSPADGPEFVTRVRNRIAHPPRAGSGYRVFPPEVARGAWRLSLKYLQLALLNWLGYRGTAVDPVDLTTSRVPWP